MKSSMTSSTVLNNCLNFLVSSFLFICLILPHYAGAQQDQAYVSRGDTTLSDVERAPGTLKIMFTGKPGKALAYSLLVPGGGQLYNRRYWKAPIVWGGVGLFIYYIDRYSRLERSFVEEIDRRVAGQTQDYGAYSVDALRNFRDITNVNKQYSYLGLGAVYLLGAIEAFVDRHLMEFDVNPDLTLHIRPVSMSGGTGIGLVLTFP